MAGGQGSTGMYVGMLWYVEGGGVAGVRVKVAGGCQAGGRVAQQPYGGGRRARRLCAARRAARRQRQKRWRRRCLQAAFAGSANETYAG